MKIGKHDIGPTGEFPHGKMGPDDEGGINVAVGIDEFGLVRFVFGKPVTWLSLPREQAVEFAKLILTKAGAKKIEITL
jgi:hypothetical protein